MEIMATNLLNKNPEGGGFTSSEPHPREATQITGVSGITSRMIRNQPRGRSSSEPEAT